MQQTPTNYQKSFTNSKCISKLISNSRHFKKVTDLKRASFASIDGLLISDKTGEIGFINLKNIDKLPKLDQLGDAEESKDLKVSAPAFEEDNVYKTLCGH